jgi:hypothetical protein
LHLIQSIHLHPPFYSFAIHNAVDDVPCQSHLFAGWL